MKRIAFLVLFAAGIAACKKGDSLTPQLFGKWEITRVYAGFINPPDSTFKPGNGNILQLNSDSTFNRYANGQITAQGTFHTQKNGWSNGQNSYDVIWFDPAATFKSILLLNQGILTIKPLNPDVSTTDYDKIGN